MNKISWFKRLFMSWDQLVEHIKGSEEPKETIEELKSVYNALIEEKDKSLNIINERNKELLILQKKLEDKIVSLQTKLESEEKNVSIKSQEVASLNESIAGIKATLEEKRRENLIIKEDINKKLLTLEKMENTFFGATGNKGKGELGEIQVKSILETSDLPRNFWVENLTVGNNVVEFAIKSGETGKWIPVDSKVLDAKPDEDGNIVIDNKYVGNIKKQAQEIAKYLSKENTAGYGIMVLQSDAIYMEVYKTQPHIFREILNTYRVHIASPSSFVQFAWSISNIVEIYDKVHQDDKIFDEMVSTMETAEKFARKLLKVHKEFNIAMNSHYPALENKSNKLISKLNKSGKLKEVIQLDARSEDE